VPRFDRAGFQTFRFTSYTLDEATGVVLLHYALDGEVAFTETIVLPGAPLHLDARTRGALDHILRLLHLIAGTSYYKTAIPPRLVVETGPVPEDVATFVSTVYREGLAEFAWRNDAILPAIVLEGPRSPAGPAAPDVGLERGPLVPVGGGKDSAVTIEALRRAGADPVLFSVGEATAIMRTVAAAGLPHLVARRTLPGELFDVNRAGAYNGHVPVTAIVSLIACAVAVVHGHRYVVMSNERSASVGSEVSPGVFINHQYSKGIDFERDLRAVLRRYVAGDLEYYSLLRPLSEVAIARAFARLPRYRPAITSCNAAFRIDPLGRSAGWCGQCAKCQFVFLCLAPFMTPDELQDMIGHALLDDAAQVDGFAELLGLRGHKPFECVGEIEEARVALVLLSERPAWRDRAVVEALAPLVIGGGVGADDVARVFARAEEHFIPARHLSALDATD
jgi:hypothetical protein